jgi:hypothetical protein
MFFPCASNHLHLEIVHILVKVMITLMPLFTLSCVSPKTSLPLRCYTKLGYESLVDGFNDFFLAPLIVNV